MRSSHEQRRSVVSGAGGDSGEERAWGERAGEHGRSPRPSGDSMLAMALLWPNYGPTMAQLWPNYGPTHDPTQILFDFL